MGSTEQANSARAGDKRERDDGNTPLSLIIRWFNDHVFERHTSTGSVRFAILGRAFEQIFGQIVYVRENTLGSTNLVASRHMESEKDSLPVNVRRSKSLC